MLTSIFTSLSPALVESVALSITEAIQSVYDSLFEFAGSADFFAQSEFVFGQSLNLDVLSALQQQWLSRDFSGLPDLKLLSASDLQGANGAFAGSTGEIYLSEGFLSQYVGSPQVLAAVLLEEVGHSVDWRVNAVDTVGDEGEMFSAVLRGVDLSADQVQQMKQNNDSVVLNLGGSLIAGEKSDGIYSSSNPLTPTKMTNLFVFGSANPSSPDYNPHINDTQTIVTYDLTDFMSNGAGRYAYPSLFPIVESFLRLCTLNLVIIILFKRFRISCHGHLVKNLQ